jgi:hypothetical protein
MDPPRRKEREMSKKNRRDVLIALLAMRQTTEDFQLHRGSFSVIARQFNVGRATIRTQWLRCPLSRAQNRLVSPEVLSRNILRAPPPKYPHEMIVTEIPSIPLRSRKTFRALAFSLGVSTSVIWRAKKAGIIFRHSSSLRPSLTPQNELARVEYALSERNVTGFAFNDQLDCIHVDEKWFDVTKKSQSYLMAQGEAPPNRTSKNSLHPGKVSFQR